jgi:hypothetical protein
MQALMHDQPQPFSDHPKNNSGERGDADYRGPKCYRFPKWLVPGEGVDPRNDMNAY